MTRKRFIKTLMGYGISRNEARLEADELQWLNENTMENNQELAFLKKNEVFNSLYGDAMPEKMDSYKDRAARYRTSRGKSFLEKKMNI